MFKNKNRGQTLEPAAGRLLSAYDKGLDLTVAMEALREALAARRAAGVARIKTHRKARPPQ